MALERDYLQDYLINEIEIIGTIARLNQRLVRLVQKS